MGLSERRHRGAGTILPTGSNTRFSDPHDPHDPRKEAHRTASQELRGSEALGYTGLRERLVRVARVEAGATQRQSGREGLFRFARRLRAVPGAGTALSTDPEVLRAPAAAFAEESRKLDGKWVDGDEVFTALCEAWPKIRVPAGGPLEAALSKARRDRVALGPPFHAPGVVFELVLGVAYWLQRDRPGESILLPVTPLATLLGVSRTRLTPILGQLRSHGILSVVAASSFMAGRATEYRFDLDHPLLTKTQGSREPGQDDEELEPPMAVSLRALGTATGDARGPSQ